MGLNLSGTISLVRLLRDPSLCLPHHTIPTFNHLPVPLSSAFEKADIRAVVLDKDNCFAAPKADKVFSAYKERFEALRKEFPGAKLVIVSNTAGSSSDRTGSESKTLASKTGVHVLSHTIKKPGCWSDVIQHFHDNPETQVTSPAQIAVIGDRLFTDVVMANLMGSTSIWIKDGAVKDYGFLTRTEQRLSAFLIGRGYQPPRPSDHFDT